MTRSSTRVLAAVAALAGAAALTTPTLAAPEGSAAAKAKPITGQGIGAVKVGARHAALRKRGLVGRVRPGCPLGLNTRAARLKAPLKGSVDIRRGKAKRIRSITLTGGRARARGVGIGSTIKQIRAAFPSAKVDRSTEDTFLLTLVRIPRSDGGRFQFGVDTGTGRTTLVGVPFIAFCE